MFCVDHFVYDGKAYPGVHVGEIDVGGKTEQEITQLVEDTYGSRIESTRVLIFESEDDRQRLYPSGSGNEQSSESQKEMLNQLISEDVVWLKEAEDVGASLNLHATAQEAVSYGKGLSEIGTRLAALFTGATLDVHMAYSEQLLGELIDDVNNEIGHPRTDYNIEVSDGVATVTEGEDGKLVDNEDFTNALSGCFLSVADKDRSFAAVALHAPVRITHDAATLVADTVNKAIADGADITYADSGWHATANMIGQWVTTDITNTDEGWKLVPHLDTATTKAALLDQIKSYSGQEPVAVSFEVSGSNVRVVPKSIDGEIPLIDQAVVDFDNALFGNQGTAPHGGALEADGTPISVEIGSTGIPVSMEFSEALNVGLVSEIKSYTTSYTYGTTTSEARNYNIHLAADYLNNGIIEADGGKWSFHEMVGGECNEERGFKSAGIISEGEYTDSIGGGICQVATTVFNAVYDAGLPVNRRHNHTLYISSYPAGRDAAVSWPDLDLIWTNDTSSDILLQTSYTEGTLTATLYGVDPQYKVTSEASDWEKGEEYSTIFKVNEDLAPTASVVKTRGQDGRSMYIERTVCDKDGEFRHMQRFTSHYDPDTEVIEVGTEFDIEAAEEELKKKKEQEDE